jgi:hypothetical protein
MTNMNAADLAKEWSQRLGASGEKMRSGIQSVKTAPGQTAARQKEVWAQNVMKSKDKWASRVASVPLTDWQSAMIDKGLPRVASGATAAEGKMADFLGKLLPYEQNMVNSLPPRGDFEQNLTRMTAAARKMKAFTKG